MRLKTLNIRRKENWEDKERRLVGTVVFEDDNGNEIKINVDEGMSNQIVELCATGIVRASHAVATMMVKDVVHNHTALEHRPDAN